MTSRSQETRPLSVKTLQRIVAAARSFGWPDAEVAKIGCLLKTAREKDERKGDAVT